MIRIDGSEMTAEMPAMSAIAMKMKKAYRSHAQEFDFNSRVTSSGTADHGFVSLKLPANSMKPPALVAH